MCFSKWKPRKKKKNKTHTRHPSQPSTNNKQIKKIKKKKTKKQKQTKNTFAPEMDFTASIVVCLYFGVPTNHSRDQPAWSISSVDSLCISWMCWKHSSENPLSCLPNHYSKILQSVDTAERRAETLVSSLLALEDVTMLKWSGNIKEQWALGKGIFPPTTLGGAGVHGWLELAQQKASWTKGCHPAVGIITITTLFFPFACLQSSRGLNGGQGLNKYLPLFQVGKESWS